MVVMPAVEVDVVLRLEEGQLLFQGTDAGLALVQLKLGQPVQDPVSYTHLTLPTKA